MQPTSGDSAGLKRSFASDATATVAPTAGHPTVADLDSLPCAKVATTQADGRKVLTGFVASPHDLETVKAAAAATPDTTVGDIAVAPWPRCELLLTLADELAAPGRPMVAVAAAGTEHGGDTNTARIEVQNSAQPSFVYLSVLKPDGSVVHLLQPGGDAAPTAAGATLVAPTAPQTGTIVALAARVPLFGHPLAANQTDREYLSALRRALMREPLPGTPDHEVVATISPVRPGDLAQ
jgi:hypothetical protein